MTRLILDVDTGNDDAVAIMLAALHPDLELLGCTTVWGNLDVADTTTNTLRVLDHIGRADVGVYSGASGPYAPRPFPMPQDVRRDRDKLHDRHLPIPDTTRTARAFPAVEWLVETLRSVTQPITLVPVAPLTNIAAAVTVDPRIVDAVETVVIMGGGHAVGNITPSAEANIWHDPAAADVVLNAGFQRLVLVTLDATHQALISADQCAELASLGTPAATAAAAFITSRIDGHESTQPMARRQSAPVHDALCVAYLVLPQVLGVHPCHVAVETTGYLTYGRTVIDTHRRGTGAPNAHVAMSADADLFYNLLTSAFSNSSTI